jgi:hypothetical protein
MEQIVKQAIGGTVTAVHRIDGEIVSDITNTWCTVYRHDGSLLKPETAAVVDAQGTMSIQISAQEAETALDWCRAHFTYQAGGDQESSDVYFHIASQLFNVPFYTENLLVNAPYLKNRAPQDDPGFNHTRNAALDTLYCRLENAGRRPWKIINLSALQSSLKYLWLSLVCEHLSTAPDDIWAGRADENRERFEAEFERLNLVENQDGSLNAGDSQARPVFRSKLRRA